MKFAKLFYVYIGCPSDKNIKEETSLTFKIINLYGSVANQFWFAQLPEGEHIIQIPIDALSPGIYYVEIQSSKTKVINKMVKAN